MKFQYNPEISLGNILQIASLLGGVAAGYGALVQANAIQDQILINHEKEIQQVRQISREQAEDLKSNVKEIKTDVKELDKKLTDYVIKSAAANKR